MGSPTSPTCRGCCARVTCSASRSRGSPRSRHGSIASPSVHPSPRRSSSLPHSELPRVVDADWLAAHLADEDLVVGDVRGPNAHMRGHIPGSRPLVLGSPPPGADASMVEDL